MQGLWSNVMLVKVGNGQNSNAVLSQFQKMIEYINLMLQQYFIIF